MISIFKKFIKSRAAINGMWLYILQLFNTVIPLVTLPYITRILGPTEYGYFSIAINLINYFMVVVEYGFHMSGARKASLATNIDELHKTFTSIVLSRLFLCLVSFALVLLYAFFFIESKKQVTCLMLLFLIPLGMVLQQNWLFQGLQRMKFVTITSVIARSISLVCIFVFVRDKDDLALYCICYSITTVIIGLVGTCFAITKIHVRFVKVQLSDIVNELKSGWYVFTTSLSSKVFSAFGITVLGFLSTEHSVGIYSAIYKIPQMILLLWNPVSQVMYPISSKKMTDSYTAGRKYIKRLERIIVPIFGIGLIFTALVSKLVIRIAFGSEFETYYYLIFPLLLWVFFGIINNFTGIQTLLAGGYSKEYSRCFMLGIVLIVTMNLLFVYLYDMIGAAIAASISEFLLGVLLYLQVKILDKRHCINADKR